MMHDEFLHRLRKDPRPEFAARLRAELKRQATPPLRARVPSLVRTLITLLFLGGAAFAITSVVLRGLPTPLVELVRHYVARNAAERARIPVNEAGNERPGDDLQQGEREWSSPPAALQRGVPPHSATSTASPSLSPGDTAPGRSSDAAGAAPGPQPAEIRVVTSWAANPYVVAAAERSNSLTGESPAPVTHIDVSVRDSDHWPGPMCSGGLGDVDVAYAFEPAGTVSAQPCRDASGDPSPIVAIPVGYEAVILARSPLYGELDLTQRDVFLALAKWIPDPVLPGTIHENAYTTWRQIDSALRPDPIEFMGPPLSSGAGRSMIELLMERGCNTFFWIAELKSTDPAQYARICRTVRTDGVYTEASGLSPSNLLAEPNAVGIFGFAAGTNPPLNVLSISKLDGVQPTLQGIESGSYPGSSGFYLYVNVNRLRTSNGGPLEFRSNPDSAYVAPP